jgi:hypothetical protein
MWSQNVRIHHNQSSPQYTPQQTNAAANYQRAMADYEANPRATGKQFQRAGLSSSKGTAYAGSAASADAYAKNMAGAEAARMGDAYHNADMHLGDQVRSDQFGMALARLNEQRAQNQAMNNLQTMGNATGFMGDMFQNMMGGFGGGSQIANSLLQGLL